MEKLREVYNDLCSFNDYIRQECPEEPFLRHASSDLESTLNQRLKQIQLTLKGVENLPEPVAIRFNIISMVDHCGNLRGFSKEMRSEEFMTLQSDLAILQVCLANHLFPGEDVEEEKLPRTMLIQVVHPLI